jgi:serine phosphatase RsbU (regulator of sigma subunit)/Tfp pilus assembly protein PilF
LKTLFTSLLLFIAINSKGAINTNSIDSLEDLVNFSENDTIKINAALKLGDQYYYTSYKEANVYYKLALMLSKKTNYNNGKADAYNGLGVMYYHAGYLDSALINWKRGIKIYKQTKNRKGLADTYNNLAFIYKRLNNLDTALAFHNKSINIKREELSLSKQKADSIRILNGLAGSFNNKGKIFIEQKRIKQALDVFELSLKYRFKTGNLGGAAFTYSNIGLCYFYQGQMDSSQYYYSKSLDIHLERDNKKAAVGVYINYGNLYISKQDTVNARISLLKALNTAKNLNDLFSLKQIYESLIELYTLKAEYKNALETLTKLKEIDLDLKKEATRQEIKRIEMENEHIINTDRMENEIKRKRYFMMAMGIAILSLISFAIFLIYLNNVRKSNNSIISKKNIELEEKNKNISDSLSYAKRIQSSILPSSSFLNNILKDVMVYFKPKELVSGDFYWAHKDKAISYIALADCTGHGVPGALMSMIGFNGLNQAVLDLGMKEPSDILNSLNEFVLESLKHGETARVKDGMDISLCMINHNNLILTYSGALMKLYIIRDSELIVLRSNRFPIGNINNNIPFTQEDVQLKKGDQVCLFSDGYVDQFGGKNGKKFKYNNFRKLILNISKPGINKKDTLDSTLAKWKGMEEQIDDISLISFKV